MKTKPSITSVEFKNFSTRICRMYPEIGSTFTTKEIYDEYFGR
jgi:hypothetical protein